MQAKRTEIDLEPDGSIIGKAVRQWCLLPRQGSLVMKLELHELDPAQEGVHRSLQIGMTELQVLRLAEHLQMALERMKAQRPQGSA